MLRCTKQVDRDDAGEYGACGRGPVARYLKPRETIPICRCAAHDMPDVLLAIG